MNDALDALTRARKLIDNEAEQAAISIHVLRVEDDPPPR